jgi:hypothetical protein
MGTRMQRSNTSKTAEHDREERNVRLALTPRGARALQLLTILGAITAGSS